jgi:DNA-3-methyladenine glycosylase
LGIIWYPQHVDAGWVGALQHPSRAVKLCAAAKMRKRLLAALASPGTPSSQDPPHKRAAARSPDHDTTRLAEPAQPASPVVAPRTPTRPSRTVTNQQFARADPDSHPPQASASVAAHLSSAPVEHVAPTLLNAVLRCGGVAVRLTEVEAYAGSSDPGSHSYRGRTARNAVMFGPPGYLYVYLIYGMHCCANIVVGSDGDASAVLLRAGEVVEGLEAARARRPGVKDAALARGPACLCRVLGIDRQHDDAPLLDGSSSRASSECTSSAALALDLPAACATRYRTGPRVGLRLAADRPWRFWLPEETSVSVYRPAVVKNR